MKKVLIMALIFSVSITMLFGTSSIAFAYGNDDEYGENAVNTLNYLAVLTQEINDSKNNKLYLEDAATSLYNDTNPIMDEETQTFYEDLQGTIEKYRMIDVKRDRLQYVYEQNKADAIRSAIPNPIGLLSATNARSLGGIAVSCVYMAIDAKSSYDSAMNEAEKEYMEDGWELEDKQAEALMDCRIGMFNYMVNTTRRYDLSKNQSLNEESVEELIRYKAIENNDRKIDWLEGHKSTYKYLGEYWLILADCYYKEKDYEKCINAVNRYKKLDVQVFRKDAGYAKVLPLATVSAENCYKDAKYVKKANNYMTIMLENIKDDDWDLRYFAAQVYVDLYNKTKDSSYLSKAYECAKANINVLVGQQLELNQKYLEPVEEIDVDNYTKDDDDQEDAKEQNKQIKKEVKKYNKMIKEERKTALSPASKPLILNCDLAYAIADKAGVSNEEKERLDGVLHSESETVFLSKPLNDLYDFDPDKQDIKIEELKKGKFEIPAQYVSEASVICLETSDKTKIKGWEVKKVKRDDPEDGEVADINTFVVKYESKEAKDYKYKDGEIVTLKIYPKKGAKPEKIQFKAKVDKTLFVIKSCKFEKVN